MCSILCVPCVWNCTHGINFQKYFIQIYSELSLVRTTRRYSVSTTPNGIGNQRCKYFNSAQKSLALNKFYSDFDRN